MSSRRQIKQSQAERQLKSSAEPELKMPPKIQNKLAELKKQEAVANKFKNEMIPLQNKFVADLEAFRNLMEEHKSEPKVLDKAFVKVVRGIEHLKEGITKLKTTEIQQGLGVEDARRVRVLYHNFITDAYFSKGDYMNARRSLDEVPLEDRSLIVLLNYVILEAKQENTHAAHLARKTLLESMSNPHNQQEIQKHMARLKIEAGMLLKGTFTDPSLGMGADALIPYHHLLSVVDLVFAVEHSEHEPDIQAQWRRLLFIRLKAVSGIPGAIPPLPNGSAPDFSPFYHQHAQYLLKKGELVSCIKHIQLNLSYFKPGDLAGFAFQLIMRCEKQFEVFKPTLLKWLLDAAVTFDPDAMHYFISTMMHQRQTFDNENTFRILEAASNSELQGLKASAFLIRGMIFDGEITSTISVDKKQALTLYHDAAELGSAEAYVNLASMYARGEGTACDEGLALAYYEKAHQLKDPEAGFNWVDSYLNSELIKDKDHDLFAGITKSLAYLKESEELLHRVELDPNCNRKAQIILAKIAYYKVKCLMMRDQFFEQVKLVWRDNGLVFLREPGHKKNPELMDALNYVLTNGDEHFKCNARELLGEFYSKGMYVEPDDSQALYYFQQALAEYDDISDYPKFEASLSQKCAFILRIRSHLEPNLLSKRSMQSQALAYSQRVMAILGEQLSQDIVEHVNPLMSQAYEAEAPIEHHRNKATALPLVDPKTLAMKSLTLLKMRLEVPVAPSIENLLDLSELAVAAGNFLVTEPSILPRLAALVRDCVAAEETWDLQTIYSVLQAVGKWHLSSATAALETLFMHLPIKSSFSNHVSLLKGLSHCNFSPDMQRDNILPYVKIISEGSLIPTIKSGQFSIAEAARLFHVLALFDANQPDEAYLKVAKLLFTALKRKLAEARLEDVSQIYHAYHYFNLHYPKVQWSLNADLKQCIAWYEPSLMTNRAGKISKTQAKIYESILNLDPLAKQEVFIAEAGRQADFTSGHLIIQYNGDQGHEMVNDQGGFAYHSLKENLCYVTLVKAAERCGKKVARISRTDWAQTGNDVEAGLSYLKRRFPDLLNPLECKTEKPERDEKPGMYSVRPKPKSKAESRDRSSQCYSMQ